MTHNALSRSMERMPAWIVQAVVTVLLMSAIAWVTWASVINWKQEVRIGVVETKVEDVNTDIHDIKETLKEMNKKLDKMNERRR